MDFARNPHEFRGYGECQNFPTDALYVVTICYSNSRSLLEYAFFPSWRRNSRGALTMSRRSFLNLEMDGNAMILRKKQLAVLIGQAFAGAAIAVSAGAVQAQDAQKVERVEVTGSSIKRVLEEQALPVQILSRDDIGKSGAVNIEQLLQSLPAVSAAGGTTKSQGAGLSTYGQSTVSLRGLGDNRTLVLINGRRMAPFGLDSAAVDINAIPMDAIERVEVLTDGASSIYGSDAMAGVINFILRRDFEGVELNVDMGRASRSGGGASDKFGVVLGAGSLAKDNYNFMLTASIDKQDSLKARDRAYAASGNNPPFFSNGATGGGNIEGVWIPGQTRAQNLRNATTNPYGLSSSYYGNPWADSAAGCIDGHFSVPGVQSPSTSSARCFFDSAPYVALIPETEKKSVLGSFTVKLNPQTEFYGQGSWVNNTTMMQFQPSPVRTSFLTTDSAFAGSGVDAALLLRPNNPNYPSAWLNSHGLAAMNGQVLAVTQRAFIARNRTQFDQSTQTRLNLGFKGVVKGWDYDTAVSRDQSKVKGQVVDGYFSQLGLATALNSPTSTWNPWAPGGVQSAEVASAVDAAKYIGATAGGSFTRTSWDGRISNTIGQLAGGDIGLSLGSELRKEQFEVTAPAILESGDIAGLGGGTIPMTASRKVSSVFGEVNLPFLSNLEANASIRADKYSDLKRDSNPVTGKISARWTPAKEVTVRSSYGTGFRAPSLYEMYQPETLATTEQFDDLVAGPDYQANAKNGGNRDLVPETSKQWSLGAVFTPVKTLTMRVDYFNIEIDKYITNATAAALVSAARAGQTGFVTFNPDGTPDVVDQRAINAGLAKFAGFDLGVSWSDKFGVGRFGIDYAGTVMTKATLKTPDGTEDGLGTLVDPNGLALKLAGNGGVIMKYKHKLSFNWSQGEWGATLTQNYTHRYRDANDLDDNRHSVPGYAIYDLQTQYTGIKGLKLALGIKNLFDRDPPLYINATNYFMYGYDPAQYDPLGRFIYVKATFKF
jgi:iron complex outermembrane receptor protein